MIPEIIAATPAIINMLYMLLPRIFPIPMFVSPLLIAFTIFTYKNTISQARKPHPKTETKLEKKSLAKLALGVALLYAGSVLAVDNIVDIADSIGVSEKIIGITVLAIGTSLPELITSVAAIRRGETNIGIGNILGSNIYNILMIAGVAAIISGITAPKLIEFDYIIMLAFGAAMLILLRGRIARREGIILTTAYVAYLGFLILF